MTPTTTIVAVGMPPIPPHRDLPHTGIDVVLLAVAGLCVVVGVLMARAGRRY